MKYATLEVSMICASLLTGCNLNDLSNAEAVKTDIVVSATSLNEHHGVVGNQIISKQGNHWIKTQTLDANNSGWSGETVSINQNQVIIADAHNQAAKIFSLNRHTGEWELTADLNEPSEYGFGESVYIDNKIALVGVPFSNSVISYKNMGGYWEEETRITPSLVENAYFGGSIDYENGYLFVGAKTIDKVFIYQDTPNGYELIQTLDHFDANVPGGKQYGWSLDANKNRLAVAAYRDWSDSEQTKQGGKVHIYEKQGNTWQWTQALTAFELDENTGEVTNISGSSFGHNLAMEGTNLLIGDDGMEKIFQFKLASAGEWQATRVIEPMENRTERFGYFLDINHDYLLAGGLSPTLFGPQVKKAALSGKVIDANGFPINRAVISGFLDDVETDETGTYTTSQAISWQGNIQAALGSAKSELIDIQIVDDITLEDIQLDVVPTHYVIGAISGLSRTENVEVSVSGIDEPILAIRSRFSITLDNGWQGEIRPISDIYDFEPASITIEKLLKTTPISFQASPKN